MRGVTIDVPRSEGARALDIATRCEGTNVLRQEADSPEGPRTVVTGYFPNRQVEHLLEELGRIQGHRVSFAPQGAIVLHPPADETPDQVLHVQPRSPLEVFFGGLQSVGAWSGFLGYAAAAGAIVWIGLFTNTIFLLVAAMLVAPFAGPAMNAALATARGDHVLLGRSVLRYTAGLVVSAAVSAALTLVMRQEATTPLMVEVINLSSVTFLLPIVAGAAGALNLVQSERNSLVSGAAVGILIAASLAPAVGIVGMASVLREWEMVQAAGFLLALQLLGINLAGATVFLAYGVTSGGSRYARGRGWVTLVALGVSLAGATAAVAWQLHDEPEFERSTIEHRARALVQDAVGEDGAAAFVDADVRFTRADTQGHPLLVEVYVQRAEGAGMDDAALAAQVRERVEARLTEEWPSVTPLVDVTVLAPPARTA